MVARLVAFFLPSWIFLPLFLPFLVRVSSWRWMGKWESFIASATCFSLSICVGAGRAPLVSLVTHPPDSSSTSIFGGPQCGSWNWCSSHWVIGVTLSQFRCSFA
ncbi:hypothetical protein CFC21_018111 [Triticum aestivum]|uniref:Secreted peptide n=2 Tax=Triticum aestivum TaxID=4565 RepID=A0A9R1E2G7_WHEAT|nr:hypothetical protein CFC21_018111 [Triticum aestivum]